MRSFNQLCSTNAIRFSKRAMLSSINSFLPVDEIGRVYGAVGVWVCGVLDGVMCVCVWGGWCLYNCKTHKTTETFSLNREH